MTTPPPEMTREIALLVRRKRIEERLTWREIADDDEIPVEYCGNTTQLDGMDLCARASAYLGETWE